MTLVISNFNYVPVELSELVKQLGGVIYDQSNNINIRDKVLQSFPDCYIEAPHTGHNLSDYCEYIINNYYNLPKVVRLIKGNIYPRHFSSSSFFKVINRETYFPLYSKSETSKDRRICGNLCSNLYYELNDPWYMQTKTARYFSSYDDFMGFFFTNYISQRFIIFNPGACQIVTREQITQYPIQFWQNLKHIITYSFFPAEAYVVERAFFSLFIGSYTLSRHAMIDLSSSDVLDERMDLVASQIQNYRSLKMRIKRKLFIT